MTKKTRQDFQTAADLTITTNAVGDISGADINNELDHLSDSARFKLNDSGPYAVTAGSATVYTLTIDYPSAYEEGFLILIKPHQSNSGADPTINITPTGGSSLGAKTLKDKEGNSITADDFLINNYFFVTYDGTDFRILQSIPGSDVTKVGTTVNNQIAIWTGDGTIEGDTQLCWDSGKMGIGTSSPAKALVIEGDQSGGDESRVRLVNTNPATDNTFDIIASSAKIQILQSGLTTANVEIGLQGFYPIITMEAGTGHVGINDSTPSEQLDVNGTVRADAFSEFSTPLPEEEALPIVLAMKNKSDGTIDHTTFPGYKKEEVSWADEKDDKGVIIKKAGSKMKESVSISLQIKYALKAIQELRKEIDSLKNE